MSPIRSHLVLCVLIAHAGLLAQPRGNAKRLSGRIESSAFIELHGHMAAHAQPRFDRGPVDPSLPLSDLALLFRPSTQQQTDLDRFLTELQDPTSPNYHHWLTPEEYADRFGVTTQDLKSIESWLSGQGFRISYRARARNWIAFAGTAQQVEGTFRAPIHHYLVEGEKHYANASEPFIPAALAGIVSGIRGLDDFRLKPLLRRRSLAGRLRPEMNAGADHFLAPDDFAAIYNLRPLYSAGFDGSGQKLAVVGQTDIVLSDIAAFRSIFNLPVNAPQLVLYGSDPGLRTSDLEEAALDLEWAGAVARNAKLIYVYSTGVFSSLQYAIDQALAPVITMSYGACENASGNLDTYRTVAQQAASEGISWVASSGDSGAAGCDSDTLAQATQGQAVVFPSSIPEVTAVGGTEFNENGGSYWSAANGTNQGSATGYIPEVVWNDTSINGTLTATGGGTSIHFATPSWQTGAGFPNNGHRDVPDVSLAASADHDGFVVCVLSTNCPSANWQALGDGAGYVVFGGTSVAAPAFAGILTLINHYLVGKGIQAAPGLGSANQTLYWVAQNSPSAFHDVTGGNNIVPCRSGSTSCATGSFGFAAGTGYDQATGLGSVDGYNLAMAWAAATLPQITSLAPATPAYSVSNQTITASGSGFQSGLTVQVTSPTKTITSQAGTAVTPASVQFTSIFNVAGTWKVQVVDPDGRESNLFFFTVTAPGAGPAVSASLAFPVTSSSATVNGTVNPNGMATLAWFLYGTSSNLSGAASTALSTTVQNLASGSTSTAISANLTGLMASTTYYYQLLASNAAGTTSTPVTSFSTGPISIPGTKVGVFRGGNSVLEDSNGNGIYEPGVDRYIAGFSGPGGFLPGDIGVAGDWNGDGRSKIGIYRSSTGTWYLDTNNDGVYNTGDYTYQFGGLAGDVPVVGNWSAVAGINTHKTCIGIYRPGGSVWLLDLNCDGVFEGTPTDAFFPFGGLAGDVPVVGNWNGGTTRVGVVRKYAPGGIPQGEPFFWVLDSGDATAGSAAAAHQPAAGSFAFGGLPGDVFVTGDWNNSGSAKAGVFRSGAAGVQPFEWVLDANGRHTPDLVFNLFGIAGDQAITGKW